MLKIAKLLFIGLLLGPLSAQSAHAQIRSDMHPEDLEFDMAFGVNIPKLFFTTFQASAELMAGKKWSAVVIAGLGLIKTPKHDLYPEADTTRVTGGGQLRKYLTGTSQMGGYMAAEMLLHIDGSEQEDARGIFTEFGGFLGYKETWKDGYFADLGVGAAGSTAPARKRGDSRLELILNVYLGYAYDDLL